LRLRRLGRTTFAFPRLADFLEDWDCQTTGLAGWLGRVSHLTEVHLRAFGATADNLREALAGRGLPTEAASVASDWRRLAGPTRLELATSGVTGRRSNQLNYDPAVVAGAEAPAYISRPPEEVVGGTGLEPVTAGV
jgi:hypothetical protein